MGAEELEEGEAAEGVDYNDPDVTLSYLDEKLQNVLGHFQKDFEGGISMENLGPKYGGYGSFLPTDPRRPSSGHSTVSHPNSDSLKNAQQNSLSSVSGKFAAASLPLIRNAVIEKSHLYDFEQGKHVYSHNPSSNSSNGSEAKSSLKVRIKVGSENALARNREAIYSDLGLSTSPYTSMDDSLIESRGLSPEFCSRPGESPRTILQVMTHFSVPGGFLMSPLQENVVVLLKKDANFVRNCRSNLFSRSMAETSPTNCNSVEHTGDIKLKRVRADKDKKPTGRKSIKRSDGRNAREENLSIVRPTSVAFSTEEHCTRKPVANSVSSSDHLKEFRAGRHSGGSSMQGSLNDKSKIVESIVYDGTNTMKSNIAEAKDDEEADICKLEPFDCKTADRNKSSPDMQLSAVEKFERGALLINGDGERYTGNTHHVGELIDTVKGNLSQESSTCVGTKMDMERRKEDSNRKRKSMESDCGQNNGREDGYSNEAVQERKRKKVSYDGNARLEGNSRICNIHRDLHDNFTRFSSRDDKAVKDESEKKHIGTGEATMVDGGSTKFASSDCNEVAVPSGAPVVIKENWVACDSCHKWRLLPYEMNPNSLPKIWHCRMLHWLPGMNKCEISQEETTKALHALYVIPAPLVASSSPVRHGIAPVSSVATTVAHELKYGRKRNAVPKDGMPVIDASYNTQHATVEINQQDSGYDDKVNKNSGSKSKRMIQGHHEVLDRAKIENLHHSRNSQEPRSDMAGEEHLNVIKIKPSKLAVVPQENHASPSKESANSKGHTTEVRKVPGRAASDVDHKDLSSKIRTMSERLQSDDTAVLNEQATKDSAALIHEAKTAHGVYKDTKVMAEGKPMYNARVRDICNVQSVTAAASSSSKSSVSCRSKEPPVEARDSPVKDELSKSRPAGALNEKKYSGLESYMLDCENDIVSESKSFRPRASFSRSECHNVELVSADAAANCDEKGSFQLPSRVVDSDNLRDTRSKGVDVPPYDRQGDGPRSSIWMANHQSHNTPTEEKSKNSFAVIEKNSRENVDSKNCKDLLPGRLKENLKPMEPNIAGLHLGQTGTRANESEADVSTHQEERYSILQMENLTSMSSAQGRLHNREKRAVQNSGAHMVRVLSPTKDVKLSVDSAASEKCDVLGPERQPMKSNVPKHNPPDNSTNSTRDGILAASVLKEARDLKHKADNLKKEGQYSESVGLRFEAALKFLQVALLWEPSNDKCKQGDSSQSMKMYSETAKLFESCAFEYEHHHNLIAAALAFKCVEVAYLKAAYFKSPGASRDHHELKATFQSFPPGESPSSSASDIDNINVQALSKLSAVKDSNSPNVAGNHVTVPRSQSQLMRLLTYADDLNCAFDATRRSQIAAAAVSGLSAEGIASLRRALDVNFHNVKELLRLVRITMQPPGH